PLSLLPVCEGFLAASECAACEVPCWERTLVAEAHPFISSPVMRPSPREQRHEAAAPAPLDRAVTRARDCLLSRQAADGHWVGELQGDTILESEWVLLMAFLGRD